ncbi:MAG: hypothetical protein ACKOHK_09010, partial [Planctomycetia bacterium]
GQSEVAFTCGALVQRSPTPRGFGLGMRGRRDAAPSAAQSCGLGEPQTADGQRVAVKRWTMVWR